MYTCVYITRIKQSNVASGALHISRRVRINQSRSQIIVFQINATHTHLDYISLAARYKHAHPCERGDITISIAIQIITRKTRVTQKQYIESTYRKKPI